MKKSRMFYAEVVLRVSEWVKSRFFFKETRGERAVLPSLGLSFVVAISLTGSTSAAAAPVTSSGLNTAVSGAIPLPNGQTQYNITGGTRPGGGLNLFHSFGDFNVPNTNIANFLNNTGLPTSNILARVTGGNISNIFGTIQTTGFGNANLFLMNPAGFLFGPTAMVNIGGMVAFTSADYLRLTDGARFNAIPNASADALLSAAPVAAFGFLGSNPGAITVQGSQLTVAEGTGISVIGGNITVQGGTVTAPGGNVNLVSVGKPAHPLVAGEVMVAGCGQNAGLSPTGFATMGSISLSQGTTVDVSGFTGMNRPVPGKVLIRGGEFVMDASSLMAPATPGHKGGTIDVVAEHALLNQSAMSAGSDESSQRGGDITFNVDTFCAIDSTIGASASSRGSGAGGTVDVRGKTEIDLAATLVGASSNTARGGAITMTAPVIPISGSSLDVSIRGEGGAPAGTITLSASHAVNLTNADLSANVTPQFGIAAPGGTIVVNGGQLFTAQQSTISATSLRGGTIQVQADWVRLTDSMLTTSTPESGNPNAVAGNIALDAKNMTLTNSQILSTADRGHGGTIDITSPSFHQDGSSVIDVSSQFGTNGTVTINGVIRP